MASLVCKVSSRTARAIQRNPVSKTKIKYKKEKELEKKFTEIKHKPTRLQVTAITAEVLHTHTHTHTHTHKVCYKIQCARTDSLHIPRPALQT